jgi:hypothetical protein
VVTVAYLPALRAGWVWDDDYYVTNNPTLNSLEGLKRIWFEIGAVPQYYPLVHTSFWVEHRVWGLRPLGYHLDNVLLHAVAAVLLWRVLVLLEVPGAWVAAALLAVHPLHVESVAWVTERKNVLSGVLYLSAGLVYLRFALRKPTALSWDMYLLSLLLFIGALWSKTVTCSLPAAILLVIWWKRGRITLKDVTPLIPFFIIGIGAALLTGWMEKHVVGAQGPEWQINFGQRCIIAGRALWFYLGRLIFPWPLMFIYPRWEVRASDWALYVFPVSAMAVLIGLILARKRIGRGPAIAALVFAGTLFPRARLRQHAADALLVRGGPLRVPGEHRRDRRCGGHPEPGPRRRHRDRHRDLHGAHVATVSRFQRCRDTLARHLKAKIHPPGWLTTTWATSCWTAASWMRRRRASARRSASSPITSKRG